MIDRKNVLLCESNPRDREELERALSDAGYEVLSAGNSAEAVRIMGRLPVDAIVADARLSDGNAFDLGRRLRSIGRDAPMVLVSSTSGIREQARAARLRDFFEKPFDLPEIVKRVDRAVRRAENGTVLILETDGPVRRLLSELVASMDLKGVLAETRSQAMSAVREMKGNIDLVLLDLDGAGPDGPRIIRELRDAVPGLYVVVSAGTSSREDVRQAYEAGAATYLRRPYRLLELADFVKRHLGPAKRARANAERRAARTARHGGEPWYRKLARAGRARMDAPAGSRRKEQLITAVLIGTGLLAGMLGARSVQTGFEAQERWENRLVQLVQEGTRFPMGGAEDRRFEQWQRSQSLDLHRASREDTSRFHDRYLEEMRWQRLRDDAVAPVPNKPGIPEASLIGEEVRDRFPRIAR